MTIVLRLCSVKMKKALNYGVGYHVGSGSAGDLATFSPGIRGSHLCDPLGLILILNFVKETTWFLPVVNTVEGCRSCVDRDTGLESCSIVPCTVQTRLEWLLKM